MYSARPEFPDLFEGKKNALRFTAVVSDDCLGWYGARFNRFSGIRRYRPKNKY